MKIKFDAQNQKRHYLLGKDGDIEYENIKKTGTSQIERTGTSRKNNCNIKNNIENCNIEKVVRNL
jgi:hypothetical protein